MKPLARPRSVANTFRVLAIFLALNSVSVWLPEKWIDAVLLWCGVGHLPDEILFRYLLRGAGFLLLSFALLIWIVATDVVRFQPLVIAVIVIFLAGAPVSCLIDLLVGLPRWWCLLDSTICVLAGGIPLWFCFWPSRTSAHLDEDWKPTSTKGVE